MKDVHDIPLDAHEKDRLMKQCRIVLWAVCLLSIGCNKAADGAASDTSDENNRHSTSNAEVRFFTAQKSSGVNVVLVLVDTLRPDYLGFYGNDVEPAPFLGKMAAQSTVFENAYSTSSWTAPSTASLFTSLYPPEHTVIQGFRAHRALIAKMEKDGNAEIEVNHMPKDVQTLPEMFKQAGYRTFGLAANINIGDEIGFSRGFDRFEKDVKAPADTMYEKVKKWRKDIVGRTPFFLYLHFNDAHTPYNKRYPYYHSVSDPREDAAARYKSEIGYIDAYLEKIWQLPGISDNTVLMIVSDHGEEFWDHNDIEHGPTLYTELNRVLMMIHGPSLGIPSLRVSENVSLVDVLPTLTEFVGENPQRDRAGLSLLPLFGNADDAERLRRTLRARSLYGHRMFSSIRNLAVWAITDGNHKLIDWWGDRRQLFNHESDPTEQHDIQEKAPQTAERLQTRLNTFKERMRHNQRTASSTEIPLDKALIDRLKTLGYVED